MGHYFRPHRHKCKPTTQFSNRAKVTLTVNSPLTEDFRPENNWRIWHVLRTQDGKIVREAVKEKDWQ